MKKKGAEKSIDAAASIDVKEYTQPPTHTHTRPTTSM